MEQEGEAFNPDIELENNPKNNNHVGQVLRVGTLISNLIQKHFASPQEPVPHCSNVPIPTHPREVVPSYKPKATKGPHSSDLTPTEDFLIINEYDNGTLVGSRILDTGLHPKGNRT